MKSILFALCLVLAFQFSTSAQVQDNGPALPVREIRFEGGRHFSRAELIRDLKNCLDDEDELYDAIRYKHCSQKLRSVMYSKGFLRATVDDIGIEPSGEKVVVVIRLNEGNRYRWGSFKIEGIRAFSEKELIRMFGQQTGDIANATAFKVFLFDKLRTEYQERGYVQYDAEWEADFIDPVESDAEGVVNATVSIYEGKTFSVGRISVSGLEPVEGEALLANFPMKSGDIYVPSKLKKWADAINRTGRFAFLDKDRHVQILTDEDAADIDLIISLSKVQP